MKHTYQEYYNLRQQQELMYMFMYQAKGDITSAFHKDDTPGHATCFMYVFPSSCKKIEREGSSVKARYITCPLYGMDITECQYYNTLCSFKLYKWEAEKNESRIKQIPLLQRLYFQSKYPKEPQRAYTYDEYYALKQEQEAITDSLDQNRKDITVIYPAEKPNLEKACINGVLPYPNDTYKNETTTPPVFNECKHFSDCNQKQCKYFQQYSSFKEQCGELAEVKKRIKQIPFLQRLEYGLIYKLEQNCI